MRSYYDVYGEEYDNNNYIEAIEQEEPVKLTPERQIMPKKNFR